MAEFVVAPAGFLLAVLWFDLMFDVQTLPHRGGVVPDAALDSIAAYYRRVTTAARPMNLAVAAMMLATLAALVVQIARGDDPRGVGPVCLALAAAAIGLAATRTFAAARRLGASTDSPAERSRLAHGIRRDHLICLPLMATVIALELITGVG
jgi:hypothetical protein